ncbi:MAG: ABC transporter substrate-binding protein [Fervidobacterium sp.]
MSRFLLTIALMFSVGFFWFLYSSEYVGYVYNPKTLSWDFLQSNYSKLKLLAFGSDSNLNKNFKLLAGKNVKIVVGPPTSAEGELILPYLKKYNMVALSHTISSTKILKSGYVYSFTPSNKFIVEKTRALLKVLGTKKLLLLCDPTNKQYSDEFKELFSSFRGRDVYYYNLSSLNDLNALEYDTVVLTLFAKPSAEAVKKLKQSNSAIKIVGLNSVEISDFLALGGQAAEGSYLIYSIEPGVSSEIDLINEVLDFLAENRFLTVEQFKRFLKHNVIRLKEKVYYFTEDGINKDVVVYKIVDGKLVKLYLF